MNDDWRPRLSQDQRQAVEQHRESDHESYKAIMDRVLDRAHAWEARKSDVL